MPMLARASLRTQNASIETRSQARPSRERALARCCIGRRMSIGFYRNDVLRRTRVAKRKPMRALSPQRIGAGEGAVILHLFDTVFNDAGANLGDVRLQRLFSRRV
ncbi:hypothetical protein [Burkholderia sp. AU16741]|uniref:hypothetical protein n=1 Tax=Burkholderia sp. AU16741 TaxID=2015347 RepID=UPI00117C440F|nr:hypothetical protein [Burkholderia sp. AU16741]